MDDRITGSGRDGDDEDGGELGSSPRVWTALVDGINLTGKALQYAEVDGMALFEGDILLGRVEDLERDAALRREVADGSTPTEAAVISGERFRWPGGVVPYEIDPGVVDQQRITDAIAHWEQKTRIRFVARTAANAAQHPDYVRFVPGDGCVSFVGCRGGCQDITVGPSCSKGNLIHELFHAVGGWHEQSREDRDAFVTLTGRRSAVPGGRRVSAPPSSASWPRRLRVLSARRDRCRGGNSQTAWDHGRAVGAIVADSGDVTRVLQRYATAMAALIRSSTAPASMAWCGR